MIHFENLIERLEQLGLSKKEARVYLTLLEFNEAQPSVIARKAELKRPTAYLILETLQKKGLASHVKKGRILYYRATRPEIFIENEKTRLKQLNTSLDVLSKSLPELLALHSQYVATPQMSVYYGKEGLIQVMEDTLTTKGELLCWSNPEIAFNHLLKSYYPTYIRKKVKRKIWVKGVFCDDPIGRLFQERGEKELREVYLIPKDKYPFKNEINIYDDKVAIISHEDEIGIIIQNQRIADTQKAIFALAFEELKEKSKEAH